MILCEYGCGQEATHQFKNGKWCCSKYTSGCSSVSKKLGNRNKLTEEHKRKISKWNKGKIISDKTRKKLSESKKGGVPWNKGKTGIYSKEVLYKMGSGFRNKNHSKETCKKMSESTKGQTPWIKGKHHTQETKNKLRLLIPQIKEKFPTFSKIEEMRYNPDKPGEKEIQVHCKNHICPNSKENGGWFTPKNYYQFRGRIYSIEEPDGTESSYFYCSDECKEECPLYGKHITELIREDQIRAGIIEDPWYNSSEYKIWRDRVFELDNSKCVWCGKEATIAHHILPQKTHPNLSLDPENGLSCCQECHYKYGHKGECSTGNLGKLVCERIIRIKEKKNE